MAVKEFGIKSLCHSITEDLTYISAKGSRIWQEDEQGLENLARHIILACFSQEQIIYIPAIVENEMLSKEWRQNWARLIQKIYEVDPLICKKCQGEMRIIAFIEDEVVIKKVLKHLGLWETRNHGPPARNPAHIPELTYDDDYS